MEPNAVWLTEALTEHVALAEGQRVLDMGCGKVLSSIFLAREHGVQVWANDLWIQASENWTRVREAGLSDRIFPMTAEAHALPYADEFFDTILAIDSYHYFGTDDLFLGRFIRHLKPGGQIGIVVPGLMKEFAGDVPEHLTRETASGGRFWAPSECFSFHTVEWWVRHWEQTELLEVEVADTVRDGWKDWLQFEKAEVAAGTSRWDDEVAALTEDEGEYLGFVRLVARRKATS